MDDPPFEFDVYAFTSSNDDKALATQPAKRLGEATELWGTKWNKPEFLLNAPRVRSALRDGEHDLIHLLVMDTIVLPTVLSLRSDVPLVIGPDIAGWSPIRDGMFATESLTGMVKNRIKYLIKNTLGRTTPFDRAVVFSRHHRNILESFGVPVAEMRILHGGVARRFSPDGPPDRNDPPELLYVGDFSAHKGYPMFLEAIAELDTPVTARLVGGGDPNESLIEEIGLTDQIVVEGFVPREELPAYYRRADLYVNPSIDELGPNTLLEALASGTPVVATDILGINEFTPPEASVLFGSRTVTELTSGIERALNDIDTLSRGAMSVSKEYHATHTLDNLAEIYADVLDQ
jgi:glycosyltransferase involved in cell wall biosynthesis